MKLFWRTMLRNPGGVIGLVILAIAIAVAVFGPLLFPTSPWRMVQRPFLPPFTLAGLPKMMAVRVISHCILNLSERETPISRPAGRSRRSFSTNLFLPIEVLRWKCAF